MSPLDPLVSLLIKVGIIAAFGGICFMEGCDYNKKKNEAAKIEGVKNAARLAKQDGIAGNNAGAQLRQKEAEYARTALSLSRVAATAPLVIVETSQTCEAGKVISNETPTVYLSPDFMWMYDLSYSSKGDVGIRPGAYGPSKSPTINEGFSAVIVPNNSECSSDREVLRKIQAEVLRKQKLYSPLFKE